MNKQEKSMDEEKFKEIYTNSRLRHDVAYAVECLDDDNKFKYFKAISYPQNYIVTKEQMKIALKVGIKIIKKILEENKNNLLFVGMGMSFEPKNETYANNHRIRTNFINDAGEECFIELGTNTDNSFMRCDHSFKRIINEEENRNEKQFGNIERNLKGVKYTYENILKLVNETFGCSFKKCLIDNYNVSPDDVMCISKAGESK